MVCRAIYTHAVPANSRLILAGRKADGKRKVKLMHDREGLAREVSPRCTDEPDSDAMRACRRQDQAPRSPGRLDDDGVGRRTLRVDTVPTATVWPDPQGRL